MFNKIFQKVGTTAYTQSDTFRVHGCRFNKRLLSECQHSKNVC